MSIQQEINARTAKLRTILAGSNESIGRKNGIGAANLDELPAAIDAIPSKEPVLQVKGISPTGKALEVTPDEGFDGLSVVYVAGDEYLVPEFITKNVTIYGVMGTYEGGRKILDIIIHENADTFTFAYEGGTTTGSVVFAVDGLPTSLTDDTGSIVNFTAGYPTSATDNNGNVVPIVWG